MESQILDFLDGNLSGAEEEELLHRLAVSPERRSMLKEHLQVREMVTALARKQKLAVPAALTAGIFSTVAALGYAGPIPTAEQNTIAAVKPPVAPIVRSSGFRRRTVALLALAFLLLGSGTTYLLTSNSGSNTLANATATPSELVAAQPMNSIAPATNIISTSEADRLLNSSEHSTANSIASHGNRTSAREVVSVSDTKTTTQNAVVDNSQVLKNTSTPATQTVVKTDEVKQAVTPTSEEPKTDIREPGSTLNQRPASPFDVKDAERKSVTQPLSFSVRTGGGKMPGSTYGYTGSLFEVRGSYHLNDWLIVSASYGQFMPYETSLVASELATNDGTQLLKLGSDIQYKNVAGLEIGASFAIEEIPIELSAGALSDFQGTLVPRASLFTSLDWSDNLQLKVGLEGLFYGHSINFSGTQTKPSFLLGTMKKQETAGFVGPAIELSWKF